MLDPSPEQAKVVAHDPAVHARVIAGPGTGKSLTAVWLLNRLTEEQPDVRARMLTFTRAATQELASKFTREGVQIPPPSTVHAFALSALMRNPLDSGVPTPLRIADAVERSFIQRDIAHRMRRKKHKIDARKVEKLVREMSSQWDALDPNYVALADMEPALREAFVGHWKKHRRVFGYTLLSEIPYRAVKLLQNYQPDLHIPDLLLVDEFQDLNKADITFLEELAKRGTTILAIGDEDQSIYSLRMADPQGIVDFPTTFDTDTTYWLTECFRCRKNVLAAATTLMRSAPEREERPDLVPAMNDVPGRFAYVRFKGYKAEAIGVAEMIAARLRTKITVQEGGETIQRTVQPREILVLVRSGASNFADLLRPELEKRDIPCVNTDAIPGILERHAFRDKLARLRIAVNEQDSLAWWHVLTTTAGVGTAFQDYVYDEVQLGETFAGALFRLLPNFPRAPRCTGSQAAREHVLYEHNQAKQLAEAAAEVDLDETGWGGWIVNYFGEESFETDEIELLRSVGMFLVQTETDEELTLERFLGKLEPTAKDLATQKDAVRVMSMTKSKGLTVDSTFVMGVERGLVPLVKENAEIDENEERRLLYVAMTRAERLCVLTFAKTRSQGRTARQGSGRIRGNRGPSELLEGLPLGDFTDGEALVAELQALADVDGEV